MMQEIVCLLVNKDTDPLLDKIENTYNTSFPETERRAFSLVRGLLKENSLFSMNALQRDGQYAGFITAWQLDGFTYVEHFAIDESARNGGIGGKAMKQFMDLCEKPIVLEVEIPVDEMSKRRIGFYERLGFVLDDHEYHQPPYRNGESWLEMRLMSFGQLELDSSFEKVKDRIYKHVYNQ